MDDLIDDVKGTAQNWTLTIWKNPCAKNLGDNVSYFLAVKELCPTTGRPHWQSYIQFHQPVRLAQLKKMFGKQDVSCRQSRGNGPQNEKYCKKGLVPDIIPVQDGENFREFGVLGPGQGFRKDIANLKRKRDENEWSMEDIMEKAPRLAMQYRNGWRDVEKYAQKRKATELNEAELIRMEWNSDADIHMAIREIVREDGAKVFIVPESGMYDEYQGQAIVVVIGYGGLSDARLQYPIPMALPGRYSTTYPAWTKVIRIVKRCQRLC